MKQIDIIGLKNFRVFDDVKGLFEELAPINILTGANNSGKSSIVKFLQMLKNSIKESQYPFDLNLTQQEHLLGDFENILFNKENKDITISLPFTFLGIKTLYISLLFTISNKKDTYHAKLRKIEVIDRTDEISLFSFKYTPATDAEKELEEQRFQILLEDYKREEAQQKPDDLSSHHFLFPPTKDPLMGYIEWNLNFDKLKFYLTKLLEFYRVYLKRKNERAFILRADKAYANSFFTPSMLISSFKNDIDINIWTDFIENDIKSGGIIKGKEPIGERDLEPEDYYSSFYNIEDILYDRTLKIIRHHIAWKDLENDRISNSIIEECFKISWKILLQRISSINYLSCIKEENSRIYNATIGSPFINLLKEYSNNTPDINFIEKHLKAFNIGKRINVEHIHKYQLLNVSITTFEDTQRELVDFGYGIKQLIVLLIQIAVLANRNKNEIEDYDEDGEYCRYETYNPSILIVEEPETNLHPKWQSLLAKLFVEAFKKFNIQLIIETHSEYLIRKFQTLVAKDEISGEKIKIFYLRPPEKTSQSKIQIETMHIQEDGSIDYNIFDEGFFDENDKLELSLLNIQRDHFLKEFDDLKKNKEENETKLSELEQKIDKYTNKLDFRVYQEMIEQQFDPSKLAPGSIDYLSSGQFLLNNIDPSSDFSPVVIQYGRTIENELKTVFMPIGISSKKLMLGFMQGSLEMFKLGTTQQKHCNTTDFGQLQTELSNSFNAPSLLKIELLDALREIRNSAGHAGQTKTKQDAIDYIQKANEFLDKWIDEKK